MAAAAAAAIAALLLCGLAVAGASSQQAVPPQPALQWQQQGQAVQWQQQAQPAAAPAGAGWQQAEELVHGAFYQNPGPCSSDLLNLGSYRMPPATTGCTDRECVLEAAVMTLPSRQGGPGCPAGPYPLVVFFAATQSRGPMYRAQTERLASYGFAVLQFDTPLGVTVPDKVTVMFLERLLTAIRKRGSLTARALDGRVDFSRLAAAGHARGAKLAALQLAHSAAVMTAFLMDPVDFEDDRVASSLWPSAAAALAALQPPKFAAISAAGLQSCGPLANARLAGPSPPTANYEPFWAALPQSSWLQVLPRATHSAFMGEPKLGQLLADALTARMCSDGRGMSAQEVTQISASTMAAWMDYFFRAKSLDNFKAWMAREAELGNVDFTIKTF